MINKIIDFSINNKFIIGLLTLTIVGAGIWSMTQVPIDAVPDIIPVAGLTDDAAIIIATVSTLAVQLKKYMVEFEEEKAQIQKAVLLEVEDRRMELKIDVKKQEQEMKEKFILRVVTIVGVFATIITLIMKFG